jgi:hypothetical protein
MASKPDWAATPEEVATLPRTAVHNMIDQLIGWLDTQDGDPDLEPNGDEQDVSVSAWGRLDPIYLLPEHRDSDFAIAGIEDEEEDDPLEANGDEQDHNHSEEDFVTHFHWTGDPGCPIADPGGSNCEDE